MYESFKKVINPGKFEGSQVFIKIEFNGEGNLSISGVIGPQRNGNCKVSCGQINMSLNSKEIEYNSDWNLEMFEQVLKYWDKWHLNDMKAGSPRQTEFVEKLEEDPTFRYDYDKVCKLLKEAGLYEDEEYRFYEKPYKYGTRWLRTEVPEEVSEFLRNLPDSKIVPAWV